jgi:hypothetical protein
MASSATGVCEVCGRAGHVHVTEVRDGVQTSRSYCLEHVPAQWRDKVPFGPHRTADEEIAFLRRQLAGLEQQMSNPAFRERVRAEVERKIEELRAGEGPMSASS